jgi:hypothetical protein
MQSRYATHIFWHHFLLVHHGDRRIVPLQRRAIVAPLATILLRMSPWISLVFFTVTCTYFPTTVLLIQGYALVASTSSRLNRQPIHHRKLLDAHQERRATMKQDNEVADSLALRNFLDCIEKLQRRNPESCQLVSQHDNTLPTTTINNSACISINSLVFEILNQENAYVLAILSREDRVNVTLLQTLVGAPLELAPKHRVLELCGFAPGSVPPIGHSTENAICIAVEESLRRNTTHTDSLILLGGGGGIDGTCTLLSWSTLTEQDGVMVASFNQDTAFVTTSRVGNKLQVQDHQQPYYKPFFAIDPTVAHCTNVAVVGRIAGVRRMARQLHFCDLAPPTGHHGPLDLPWQCPKQTGSMDMAVQLIVGNTYYSTAHDDASLNPPFKVGQLVLVHGKTNGDNPDSRANWINNKSLDLVVLSYTVLNEEQPQTNGSYQQKRSKRLLQMAGPKQQQVRKSSFTPAEPGMSYLSVNQIYGDQARITVVDCMETIGDFAKHLSTLLLAHDGSIGMVGIDCEWRPNFLLDNDNEPQPVLLMQISLHSLKRIFLMDLQKLARPLLSQSEPMNEIETTVAQVIGELFESTHLIKVGFSLMNDLQRLAASYPHIVCFQEVNAVVDASRLGRKVVNMMKQGNGRKASSSLSRLTEWFLKRTLNKEQQCSDWSQRPLTTAQVEYAALDAAVTPCIVDTILTMSDVKFMLYGNMPQLGRWKDDISFSEAITSWRFLFLNSDTPRKAAKKLRAQRIVGSPYVVTQLWSTGQAAPKLPTIPSGAGEYTDIQGVVKVPSQLVSTRTTTTKNVEFDSMLDSLVARHVGISKEQCLSYFYTLPEGAQLEFPQRSGSVEFRDAVVLFVNQPEYYNDEPRRYPNEWLEDGKVLTWFLRKGDWNLGKSRLAKKLTDSAGTVVLFVRNGKNQFLCCGRCRVELTTSASQAHSLVQLNLGLRDYQRLVQNPDFQALVHPTIAQEYVSS